MMNFDNESLAKYINELIKWNKKINLIGRQTEQNVQEVHIQDSLRLSEFLKDESIQTVIDIGSGGGLPAIPLSIAFPDKHFILTDVIEKKLGFLRWVIASIQLNAEALNITKYNKKPVFSGACVITSRAFSEIKNIIEWQKIYAPLAESFYLLKGTEENSKRELAEAGVSNFNLIPTERGCIVIFDRVEP